MHQLRRNRWLWLNLAAGVWGALLVLCLPGLIVQGVWVLPAPFLTVGAVAAAPLGARGQAAQMRRGERETLGP